MKEMNSFNSTILNIIKECNLEEFKKAAENYLNEKDTTLSDVFDRYFSEILSRKFLFNRKKIILQQIGNVNLDSIIKYAKLFIINNTKKTEFILHGN
jgi:secreted Zn-dependent insulinase-like peptidase